MNLPNRMNHFLDSHDYNSLLFLCLSLQCARVRATCMVSKPRCCVLRILKFAVFFEALLFHQFSSPPVIFDFVIIIF